MKTAPILSESAPVVQQFLVGLPSYKEFRAAEQHMRSLVERQAEAKSETDRLGAELNRLGKPNAEAEDLLAGKSTAVDQMKNAFQSAHHRLAVVDEAMMLQQRHLIGLRLALSREVNETLRSSRQLLVSAVSASLRVIRAASREDEALRTDLANAGIDLTVVDNLVFPPISSECAFDFAWIDARGKEGYQVD